MSDGSVTAAVEELLLLSLSFVEYSESSSSSALAAVIVVGTSNIVASAAIAPSAGNGM